MKTTLAKMPFVTVESETFDGIKKIMVTTNIHTQKGFYWDGNEVCSGDKYDENELHMLNQILRNMPKAHTQTDKPVNIVVKGNATSAFALPHDWQINWLELRLNPLRSNDLVESFASDIRRHPHIKKL